MSVCTVCTLPFCSCCCGLPLLFYCIRKWILIMKSSVLKQTLVLKSSLLKQTGNAFSILTLIMIFSVLKMTLLMKSGLPKWTLKRKSGLLKLTLRMKSNVRKLIMKASDERNIPQHLMYSCAICQHRIGKLYRWSRCTIMWGIFGATPTEVGTCWQRSSFTFRRVGKVQETLIRM